MKYSVLNKYEAVVKSLENPYDFEQQQLFDMALRINPKRRFLFVSKVLGKHLAVPPAIPLLTSYLLASRFMEQRFDYVDLFAKKVSEAIQTRQQLTATLEMSRAKTFTAPQALVIIGFAETATALGHGFFEKFTGNVHYFHTTREHLVDQQPTICFEEEHSHASSHRVYADPLLLLREAEIVLVDDEMTTGTTNCNIIRQLHEAYPHFTTFTLVSILDFRTVEAQEMMQQLAMELGITIHCIALFNGVFQIEETSVLLQEDFQAPIDSGLILQQHSFEELLGDALTSQRSFGEAKQVQQANYYRGSGRFALTVEEQQDVGDYVLRMAAELQAKRGKGPCLVLGTGEFMYVPMCIAAQMGEDVYYHATTRSPIYADTNSLIYNKLAFPSAEFPGVTNYLYNIPMNYYTDIFIVFERILDRAAAEVLNAQLQPYAQNIHFVTLGGVEHVICT